MLFVIAALFIAVVVMVRRDPRRLSCGVLLALAIALLAFEAFSRLLDLLSLPGLNPDGTNVPAAIALLAAVAVVAIFVIVLAVLLVANGLTMWRKERRSLANLLSLLAGLALCCVVAAFTVALVAALPMLAAILAALLLPLAYLGFVLAAYLLYAWVYRGIGERAAERGGFDAVVVLGAGLVDGRVTPLLGRRVQRGIDEANRHVPLPLVCSGGKGDDETRSEASAMAEYAVERGFDAERVIVEDRSRTTEENLRNTEAMLRSPEHPRLLLATSDYHVLRAATLLRELRIPGEAVGAGTASYYRPSATLREFAAFMVMHRVLNGIALGVLTLPLLATIVVSLLPG